jgi:hypothetical protein
MAMEKGREMMYDLPIENGDVHYSNSGFTH